MATFKVDSNSFENISVFFYTDSSSQDLTKKSKPNKSLEVYNQHQEPCGCLTCTSFSANTFIKPDENGHKDLPKCTIDVNGSNYKGKLNVTLDPIIDDIIYNTLRSIQNQTDKKCRKRSKKNWNVIKSAHKLLPAKSIKELSDKVKTCSRKTKRKISKHIKSVSKEVIKTTNKIKHNASNSSHHHTKCKEAITLIPVSSISESVIAINEEPKCTKATSTTIVLESPTAHKRQRIHSDSMLIHDLVKGTHFSYKPQSEKRQNIKKIYPVILEEGLKESIPYITECYRFNCCKKKKYCDDSELARCHKNCMHAINCKFRCSSDCNSETTQSSFTSLNSCESSAHTKLCKRKKKKCSVSTSCSSLASSETSCESKCRKHKKCRKNRGNWFTNMFKLKKKKKCKHQRKVRKSCSSKHAPKRKSCVITESNGGLCSRMCVKKRKGRRSKKCDRSWDVYSSGVSLYPYKKNRKVNASTSDSDESLAIQPRNSLKHPLIYPWSYGYNYPWLAGNTIDNFINFKPKHSSVFRIDSLRDILNHKRRLKPL